MLWMDLVHVVRRKVLVEGRTQRAPRPRWGWPDRARSATRAGLKAVLVFAACPDPGTNRRAGGSLH
jgi:hypothetical protein